MSKTPSRPEGIPEPTGELPVTFERKFRPWRYVVGHSRLSIRSIDPNSAPDHVEITFFGVLGVRLASVYQTLTIALADKADAEDMFRFSGLRESQYSSALCVALSSDSGTGHVVCVGCSVWLHTDKPDHIGRGGPRHDSILLARGRSTGR